MITESKLTRTTVAVLLMLSLSVAVLQTVGCGLRVCGTAGVGLGLRGKLVHSSTLEPIDARVGVRAFSDGELISARPATVRTEADGSFSILIPLAIVHGCGLELRRLDFPEVTLPDQIEVIVLRIGINGCEQRFDIDVATDTMVEGESLGPLELKSPILVGPCEH